MLDDLKSQKTQLRNIEIDFTLMFGPCPIFSLRGWRIYDGQPLGGNQGALASFFGSGFVVHLSTQSM